MLIDIYITVFCVTDAVREAAFLYKISERRYNAIYIEMFDN